ncbi:hypothetical protein GCM10010170_061420 [Dactylosporangium salmoneum]|uniref:ABM domain-containing protein n=1 Tax=Dactylosporangium salmoneum TaxID=53361 RepID=A0ABP5TXC6_9ACTN
MVGVESSAVIVRMWEVRAHPEAFGELLSWVCEAMLPKVEVHPMHLSSEVYASTDQRLVVVSKWRGSTPEGFAEPPSHLVARKPQFWDFTQVDR